MLLAMLLSVGGGCSADRVFGTESSVDRDLRQAARRGDVQEIEQLLSEGADVNTRGHEIGDTPLMNAAEYDETERSIPVLLANGADPSERDEIGSSALGYAALSGNVDAVRLLIEEDSTEVGQGGPNSPCFVSSISEVSNSAEKDAIESLVC